MQRCTWGGGCRNTSGDTHRHVADDGGTYEVAVFITFDFDVPAVQQHLRALVHAALDQTADSLLGLRRDQRPNICTRLVS